ncbi:hypothetical protein EES45_06945 [Streptomyces sp. ADI97-07]|nr:hypothetical protein EES45_06945 [Streptomyces sp. ADI97-07]
MAGLQQGQDVPGGGEGLQAAAVAAAAHGARLVERDVPDLARRTARPAVDVPLDHQTGADAAGDLDVGEVPDPAAAAPDELTQRPEVGVVVDVHRHTQAPRELLAGIDARPARQDRGGAQRAGLDVDRPRHTQAHADHLLGTYPGGLDQAVDQLLRPAEALGRRGVDVQRLRFLGQHLVGQVPDGHPKVRMSEINPYDDARVSTQGDAPGTASARRGGGHLDRAAVLQFANDVGDSGRGEAGASGDLGLGQ